MIKAGASVGDGTVIMENVFIDCGVTIGKNCVIEPGAVVFHHSVLGDGCVLHANAVVGCDGFGFLPDPKAGMVRPQLPDRRLHDNSRAVRHSRQQPYRKQGHHGRAVRHGEPRLGR